jgi:hypothetical protein
MLLLAERNPRSWPVGTRMTHPGDVSGHPGPSLGTLFWRTRLFLDWPEQEVEQKEHCENS